MMKRTKIILAAPVLIITFFVGTLTYFFWPFDASPHLRKSDARTFKLLTVRSTQDDGVSYLSHEYESSNGQGLYVDSFSYSSEQDARAFFSDRLQFNPDIIEQSPLLDDEGQHVGDRAVIMMGTNRHGKRNSVVLILKGTTVYTIYGNPLSQVLELEKSLNF